MTLKYCQGSQCHTYTTQDRLKGTKDNKTFQTRRRTSMLYDNNFCSQHCADDWFETYGDRAIDHFGRLTEPKHLTEENAWKKDYDWRTDDDSRRYFFINQITKERRTLTEQQYDDNNYTINTGE
tara:strand:+ start:18 stop:389 length:372 start_codon:yes stop_codon:yes gene_type:complete